MNTIQNAMTVALANATTTAKSPIITWRPEIDAYESTLKEAAGACANLVALMAARATPRWLTLSGVAGCGKTMLATMLFNEAKKHNPAGDGLWIDPTGRGARRPKNVWLDASRFADRMKEGEFDLPEYLVDDWLVVMDDLGASRDKTSFVADATYRFCNARRDKWTIFTTNLTLPEISERIDERVASRLIRDNNALISIRAGDYAMARRPRPQP